MKYILPNDICRCHDHECAYNETCVRYVQRDMARPGTTRITASESLCVGDECKEFLEMRMVDARPERGEPCPDT